MGGTDGAAAGEGTVALADNDELQARILVDGEGRTLYLFERDNGTSTACAADPCRSNWPAFAPEGGPEAGDGVDADALDTVDGQVPGHVTYQGHLLYYFAGDRAPGDVNGLGIPAWFPLDADGDKVGG